MKSVHIAFSNIQSHEFTEFQLNPGLNFILADDNNVGKSTIFKVLTFAARMPRVTLADASELMRVGAAQAYAAFTFDSTRIILWFFRDTSGKVRCFFEKGTIGISGTFNLESRVQACPAELLDALDLVVDSEGVPINFNDADSVQLVVEDSPSNDKVLGRVLVDLDVERIKANAVSLSKQVSQDTRWVQDKLLDVNNILATMSYNHSVDSFNGEKELLSAGCRVMDIFERIPELEPLPMSGLNDFLLESPSLVSALSISESLSRVVDLCSEQTSIVPNDELGVLTLAVKVLDVLDSVLENLTSWRSINPFDDISLLSSALGMSDSIYGIIYALQQSVHYAKKEQDILDKIQDIKEQLANLCPVVECPVKGKVFFDEEKCIHCDN